MKAQPPDTNQVTGSAGHQPERRAALRVGAAVGLAALAIAAALALAPAESRASVQHPPSVALIDDAMARGQIDADAALLYKAYTIFAPERLPRPFRSDTPARSGTMVLMEIQRAWDQLRPETQSLLSEFVTTPDRLPAVDGSAAQDRPSYPQGEQAFTTTHFVIHYTLSGTHAVYQPQVDSAPANGVPDYVDWVAEDAETVLQAQLVTMGWLEPPPDAGEGGDARYDVYLWNMSYYGITFYGSETLVGDNPHSPAVTETRAYYSYLQLENDFLAFGGSRRDNIRVTLAHEYNHAVQLGYDGDDAVWLMEATATWMEDEVYDEINDNYQFLAKLFQKPDIALDTELAAYGYSRFLFPRFLSEHYGGQSTVRAIWESAVLTDNVAAIENALAGEGTNLAAVLPRFAGANYVLSAQPYNAPYTYEEADGYRAEVGQIEIEAYFPFTGTLVTYDSFDDGNEHYLERRSSEYWVLSTTTGFTATFLGNPGTEYAVQRAERSGDLVTVTQVPLTGQNGSFVVYDPGIYNEIVIIVSNLGSNDEQDSYTLQLQPTGQTPPTATFTTAPVSGTLTTEFTFDASASSDAQTPSEQLEVRWDWEGDAEWDTNWGLTKIATHTFGFPGTYSVTLQVRDEIDLRGAAIQRVPVTAHTVFVPLVFRG